MYSWSVKVYRKVCHCHSKRTVFATARRASSTGFCPSRRAAQMVCSWRCKVWVDFLRRLAGGWPRAFCSSVVHAAAASCCRDSMAHQIDGGCARLTPRTPDSSPCTGYSSCRSRPAWGHGRSTWTPGTAAAADATWCVEQRRRRRRRQLLQPVSARDALPKVAKNFIPWSQPSITSPNYVQ